MVGLADENGKTYECEYGTYSKEDGFKFNENVRPIIKNGWRNLVNILFHDDLWKLKKEPVKEVTLEDIEKEFGCKVRIVDPAAKKQLTPEQKEKIDKEIEFFKRFFGIELDPEEYY